MSDTQRCPDCGRENPGDAGACIACGFPLRAEADPGAPAVAGTTVAAATSPAGTAAERPHLPRPRPPRPRPPMGSQEAVTLWLVFGSITALVLVFVAIKSNVDRARPPVAGASAPQQVEADSLRGVIDNDSTDVGARVRLGDLLYDTGNWSEAIVQYRSALRQDSSRVNALVDLGVCYYNLGDPSQAERLFLLALKREPKQMIALFNLGIVNERRDNPKVALEYYHRALQADPPPEMKQAMVEAMTRVQEKLGARPRPLGGG
jgi:tetratricopeptide (TPR) repeat protein